MTHAATVKAGKHSESRFRASVIHEHCRDCWGMANATGQCQVEDCPLYSYQARQEVKAPQDQRAALRALRAFCLLCMNGKSEAVRSCPAVDCALWPWRLGRRSARRRSRMPQAPPKPAGTGVSNQERRTKVERACMAAGQVVERLCPVCGEAPLAPGRRKCDRCRQAARRETKRRSQKRWRQKRTVGGSV